MTKILLVDDHGLVRKGLKLLISNFENLNVIGEAGDAKEAEEFLEQHRVDLVICDISLPGEDGLTLAGRLRQKYPLLRIIMLSMLKNEQYIQKAIDLKINGYLDKDIDDQVFMEAIRKVMEGEVYFCNNITQVLISGMQKNKKDDLRQHLSSITPREMEVLEMVIEGLSNKQIAEALNISAKTVNNHKTNILRKFELKHTTELVSFCLKNNLLQKI
jgi:RNA polymerase sigma factor (sigma-70 family)